MCYMCCLLFYPAHCTGVEGDSATQSSDGTEQENYHYEEQVGLEEEEQNSSGGGERECDNTDESEVYEETSGADTTGDANVYEEDSREYTTDEDQEDNSSKVHQKCDSSKEARVVSYLGDSFGSSGMGDISGGVIKEDELPQDSSREMDNAGIIYAPILRKIWDVMDSMYSRVFFSNDTLQKKRP